MLDQRASKLMNQMLLRTLLLVSLLLASLASAPIYSVEVSTFLEDFSLGDRQEALKKLIPGTNDYYFYHCLDAQHRADKQRFDALIKDWVKQIRHASQRDALLLRQAIIDYDSDPQASITTLCTTLGIHFHHRPPNSQNQQHIPHSLDQALISAQAFAAQAQRHDRYASNGYEADYLPFIDARAFPISRLRDYLRRLPYPQAPGLVDGLVKELADRHSRGFGSLPIHEKLLLGQLQELQRRRPALAADDRFIRAMLQRLQPRDGSAWRVNPQEYEAYLERLWGYVATLPAAQNSLKAHVLYHQLVNDRHLNRFNQERFVQYIQLPRSAVYVNPQYVRRHNRDHVRLDNSYEAQTGLARIGSDEDIIKSYVEHFYTQGVAVDAFQEYLSKTYTDALYAETMVLLGRGDQERWASWLGAERYRGIQDRIELAFTAQNKERFSLGEQVSVQLALKNVETLLVRVYPIHTEAWYRDQQTDSFGEFDVDGLVTEDEQRLSFDEHPALRHVQTIALPNIQKRGVYIVECIGNGYRCRSIVRLGDLHVRERLGTAGHVLRVYDESYNLVKDAVAHFGNHRIEADAHGGILLPFATAAGAKNVVIAADGFAVNYQLQHIQENYQLQIQAQLNSQDALAGQLAEILVRPQLFLQGEPVSFADVSDVRVEIDAMTIDGIHTKEMIEHVRINEVDAWAHSIRFPDRVRSVTVRMYAKIEQISTGTKQDLFAESTETFNGMLQTQNMNDLFLRKQQGGFVLDILGRNGESYALKDALTVLLKHRDFTMVRCRASLVCAQTRIFGSD